jgi:hypothetical protein
VSVQYPPFFLRTLQTALDDHEVVGFEQTGGWQKINNVLVLLYRYNGWFRDEFGSWISCLQEISDRLKVSHSLLRRSSL